MNVIEHMEKKKNEVENLFQNFFTLHGQQKKEQHTKKANIDVPSMEPKDLLQVSKSNLPSLKPKEELSKKLQRNNL